MTLTSVYLDYYTLCIASENSAQAMVGYGAGPCERQMIPGFSFPSAIRKKLGLANSPLTGLEKNCIPFLTLPVTCYMTLHNLYYA